MYIPTKNEITDEEASLLPLRHYAARAKLYAAFAKFTYQHHELELQLQSCLVALEDGLVDDYQKRLLEQGLALIKHYLDSAKRLPIWTSVSVWFPLSEARKHLEVLEKKLAGGAVLTTGLVAEAIEIWQRLELLGRLYEETCREWFLPTYTALMFSGE
jgi:hypothetical protein